MDAVDTIVPDVVLNEDVDDGVGKVLPAHQKECDDDVVEALVVVEVGVLREQAQNDPQQSLPHLLSPRLRVV